MSNGHENELLLEVKGLSKDLEYLAIAVDKSTKMFSENNEKYNLLTNRIQLLEQSQERQEKVILELKKVILDSPEHKQTGLLTEVRDLKKAFIDYTLQIKQEKEEARERAIEREKERLASEEKKEKEKAELDAKKEREFNQKIAKIGAIIAFLAIIIPLVVDYIKNFK